MSPSIHPARRVLDIQDPVVPIIAGLIKENPGTISLGQGVVHYGPPPAAAGAMTGFFDQPSNHLYTPDWGMDALTEALSQKVASENSIPMKGKRVVVTAGANMGFLNAVLAVADPGDEIILLAPFYFNHEMAVRLAGCIPRIVPTRADLTPDVDAIHDALNDRTRAVVTVSPNNPTGMTYAPESLAAINALCGERSMFHISDEAYEYFVYDGATHYSPGSAASASEHTISLFSLSKSFGFASWRIGYMVIPDTIFEPVMKVQDTNVICASAIAQHVAVACLAVGSEYCKGFLGELTDVRAQALDALSSLGDAVTIPAANGAFYVYLGVNRPLDPMALTRELIATDKVAVIPGSAFGSLDSCHLRVSYGALKPAAVGEGMGRLVDGLRRVTARA